MRDVFYPVGSMVAIVVLVAVILDVDPRKVINTFFRPHLIATDRPIIPEKPDKRKGPLHAAGRSSEPIPVEVSVVVTESRAADEVGTAGKKGTSQHLPMPGEINIGETKADVDSKYGEPTLKATRVEAGDVHQTYVYWPRRQEGTVATVIQLNNDRVVSVRSHSP